MGSSRIFLQLFYKMKILNLMLDAGDAATRTTSLIGGHVDATIIPYTSAKDMLKMRH